MFWTVLKGFERFWRVLNAFWKFWKCTLPEFPCYKKAIKCFSVFFVDRRSGLNTNTPALRARGLHTRSRWSSVISKRNQTKTFELMAFFWHRNSASVRLQNPPKAFKTHQKPPKHLERDPTLDVTLVCDSNDDRFLQTAQISLKRCRFPYISLKRLKLLMISLKAWWFP